jgi:hypothetical protein
MSKTPEVDFPRRDTTPYLKAQLELATDGIKTPNQLREVCQSIMSDTSCSYLERCQREQGILQENERLRIKADILCSLTMDSSVDNAATLAQLSPEEVQAWGKIDFHITTEFLSKGGKTLIDGVVTRAVAGLQQANYGQDPILFD